MIKLQNSHILNINPLRASAILIEIFPKKSYVNFTWYIFMNKYFHHLCVCVTLVWFLKLVPMKPSWWVMKSSLAPNLQFVLPMPSEHWDFGVCHHTQLISCFVLGFVCPETGSPVAHRLPLNMPCSWGWLLTPELPFSAFQVLQIWVSDTKPGSTVIVMKFFMTVLQTSWVSWPFLYRKHKNILYYLWKINIRVFSAE